MSALVPLDASLLNREMRLRLDHPAVPPRYIRNYSGIYMYADVPADLDFVINKKVTLELMCSVQPDRYSVLMSVHPKLYEVAEVSAPHIIPSGLDEPVRPVIHLRGLKKFDLRSLPWIATLHLID